jgi:hypothetical protein
MPNGDYMNSIQLETSQPMHLNQIDRPTVRRFVEEHLHAAQAAGARGENIHQWSLDQQDKVTQYASTLSESDATLFWTLYGEEMMASANTINDKTATLNAQSTQIHLQAAQDASNVATWISIISFFAFIIFMISLFKNS